MNRVLFTAVLIGTLLMGGCSGARRTVFLHPEYNFGVIERLAVVPFVNLTNDNGIGEFAARLFIAEMLAKDAFDVVEIGEVVHVMNAAGKKRSAELGTDDIKNISTELGVQSMIFGTVGESATLRAGTVTSHVISLEAHMVDVESGITVWSSTVQIGGPGPISGLLGVGELTRGEAARKAVKKAVNTLVR